jgi:hypothetical protein
MLAVPRVDTTISPPLSQDSVAVIKVRQGVVSGRVFLVLVTSSTLAIIAMALVWIAK